MGRSRGFHQTPRRNSSRPTSWGLGPAEVDGAFIASGKSLWSLATVSDEPLTIVRTRGLFSVINQAAASIGTGFFGAFGIGVVSNEAFAAGVASVPGPLNDSDWEGWMVHSFFDCRTVTATIGDGANVFSTAQRIEIDSKAMRKFDQSETLIGVTEVVESGAGTLEMQADTRILTKIA